MLEMIEDGKGMPREVDSLAHIILARDLKVSPIKPTTDSGGIVLRCKAIRSE